MAGLLTDSHPEAFPIYSSQTSGKSRFRMLKRSFTAAGLSGILTQFPFNLYFQKENTEPIQRQIYIFFQEQPI